MANWVRSGTETEVCDKMEERDRTRVISVCFILLDQYFQNQIFSYISVCYHSFYIQWDSPPDPAPNKKITSTFSFFFSLQTGSQAHYTMVVWKCDKLVGRHDSYRNVTSILMYLTIWKEQIWMFSSPGDLESKSRITEKQSKKGWKWKKTSEDRDYCLYFIWKCPS